MLYKLKRLYSSSRNSDSWSSNTPGFKVSWELPTFMTKGRTHTLMKRWLWSQTQHSLFFYSIFKLWATPVALNLYVWLRSACFHSSLWNSNHVPEKSSEKRKPAGICSAIFRKCIKKVKNPQVQCHKKQKHLKWKISPQTDPLYLLKKTWRCFKIVWSDSRTKQRVRLPRRRNVWSPAGRV